MHSSHIYKSDIKQEVKLIFVPWLAGKGGNSRYIGGTSASTPCPWRLAVNLDVDVTTVSDLKSGEKTRPTAAVDVQTRRLVRWAVELQWSRAEQNSHPPVHSNSAGKSARQTNKHQPNAHLKHQSKNISYFVINVFRFKYRFTKNVFIISLS